MDRCPAGFPVSSLPVLALLTVHLIHMNHAQYPWYATAALPRVGRSFPLASHTSPTRPTCGLLRPYAACVLQNSTLKTFCIYQILLPAKSIFKLWPLIDGPAITNLAFIKKWNHILIMDEIGIIKQYDVPLKSNQDPLLVHDWGQAHQGEIICSLVS